MFKQPSFLWWPVVFWSSYSTVCAMPWNVPVHHLCTPAVLVCFKWRSSYVLIKCSHTDSPASIMDVPASLLCNEWDLKQRRVVPASQSLNCDGSHSLQLERRLTWRQTKLKWAQIKHIKQKNPFRNSQRITAGIKMEPSCALKYVPKCCNAMIQR